MLEAVNELLTAYLLPIVIAIVGTESFIGLWLTAQPLLIFFIIMLPFLGIWAAALFIDFIKDSWKMIFGILIDVAVIFTFATYPGWIILVAFGASALLFLLSGGEEVQKSIYAGIGFVRILLLASFIPLPIALKVVIALVPVCTIESFFLCVTD